MAFKVKTKKGYCIKQGNTGKTVKCFTGKDAKKNADAHITKLHKKNNPKKSNRGKSAAKKH